jgi:hypothetical protein
VLFSPNILSAIVAKLEPNVCTPEVLQGLALLHESVTNTFVLPSAVNDDILYGVDHRIYLYQFQTKQLLMSSTLT